VRSLSCRLWLLRMLLVRSLTIHPTLFLSSWGDAVQDGIRIPGARFKMDLTHARRPHGLPGFPFRGFKRE
jgi:hypothetical protein